MPGKRKSVSRIGGVHTIYELWFIRRVGGKETATMAAYDELERHDAEADYQGLCRQAGEEIGTDAALTTYLGAELAGVIDRIVVEIRSRKVGEFVSVAEIVMSEVFLDDSTLSGKARSIRDGLLGVEAGQRGRLLGQALAQIGQEGTVGGDSEYGRVCRKHNRWVGRWQTSDRCWSHAWKESEAAMR